MIFFLYGALTHQRMTQDFEETGIAFMTTFWTVFCEACWIVFFQDKQLFGWLYAQLVVAFWMALCTASSRFI